MDLAFVDFHIRFFFDGLIGWMSPAGEFFRSGQNPLALLLLPRVLPRLMSMDSLIRGQRIYYKDKII